MGSSRGREEEMGDRRGGKVRIRGKGLKEVEMLSVSLCVCGGQGVLIPIPCWESQPGSRVQSVTVADTESWAVGRWGLVLRTRKMQTMVALVLDLVMRKEPKITSGSLAGASSRLRSPASGLGWDFWK